ncbi:MAG: phosphoenolpyruvate synthase [Euryarchaeota archaeon]|nr:phosphoenolpyruvate synthase [Euryarchaeota archaeon]
MDKSAKFTLWFSEIGIQDVGMVGGKNASLGEMYSRLKDKGVSVPNGFAITAHAYRHFLKAAGIEQKVQDALSGLNTHDMQNLQERGEKVRAVIKGAELPEDLKAAIIEAYGKLCGRKKEIDVAVRSSATAEDLPDASFAGQQETYLNVRGADALLLACKKCFASLFTDRAISYRQDKNFGHFNVYLSIVVQKMVRSDKASSGIIFTLDTESGFKNLVVVNSSWGLGENVVGGKVVPDEFQVFKPVLAHGKRPIVGRRMGSKDTKIIYSNDPQHPIKSVPTSPKDKAKWSITDEEALKLADWAVIIEDHYTHEAKALAQKEGKTLPHDYVKHMDIEWAKDGKSGELYIVQARPETVMSIKQRRKTENGKEYFLVESYEYRVPVPEIHAKFQKLCEGIAVGRKISSAAANVIESPKDIGKFRKGEILVTRMTDPDWEPMMKIAGGIITEQGGRTCHTAIISRELGIPCIVGTQVATSKVRTGQRITLSCGEGERGMVYDGEVPYDSKKDWIEVPRTRTKIMMNAGIPETAFFQGTLPNDGVGLAREEFIIASHIGMHPMFLLDFEKHKASQDKKIRKIVKEVEKNTKGWDSKVDYFVETLAMGIAKIGAAFWPNDVIVRMSDFKTNEYANLLGGDMYEPHEHNPMIGWRGASRYYDPKFRPAFALECKALKRVRDDMGITNVKAMIPFCRTPDEGRKVVKAMEEEGLKRGVNGFEIYVMAEIPSNCVDAETFADIFDGFSIGSNDLTQLSLGLDRDSELVAHIYNERESTVKRLIKQLIDVGKAKHKKVGICGQAPSDFPEFAEFLVQCGIDSMSLNPDTVVKTRLLVAEKERSLGVH